MRIFKFRVEYSDKCLNELIIEEGLVAGENPSDAVAHLSELFFDKNTIPGSIKVEFIDDLGRGIISLIDLPNIAGEEEEEEE